MAIKEYELNGVSYLCRVVVGKDNEILIIGSTKLLDALQPGSFEDDNDGFTSKKAKDIYDEIFYFIDEDSLKLEDVALVELLKEGNPEWF